MIGEYTPVLNGCSLPSYAGERHLMGRRDDQKGKGGSGKEGYQYGWH